MAMTKCKECHAEISTKADACPKCGAKRKRSSRLSVVLIILGVVFLLVFLSQVPSSPNAASSQPVSSGNTAQAPAVKSPPERTAEETQALADIEQRTKDNAAKLKKFYGSPDQVKQAGEDVLRLTIIKGMYADSEKKEEKALARRAAKLLPQVEQQSRELYASSLEEALIKNGMDARVSAAGGEKKTLRVSYALMSKPLVYKFQNEIKLDDQAKNLGFSKLVYTNGFDSELGQTWSVDLDQKSD